MRGVGIGSVIVQPRQAEVSETAVQFAIEQYVAGLDVTVDDNLLPVLVQVQQARRHAFYDSEPLHPAESRPGFVVEEVVEAAVGHVVVDQEELPLAAAVAQ
ncbi:L-type lectin-domain containing receptor kinase IV.2-like [Iris pallida]|uniref:L-type lectin-domain containing receptor kinase IV.2-like n=1 Tax=Iris pallida TaxID=29817 RepID=A0AAX6GLA8_IRIPA|nr:L-type lectin-domain containing receptor kinase IV.2-like [Iris pallida]